MGVVTGPDIIHEQTLERLVKQYQTELLRMCFLYLRDTELARDAVQETYIKVYRSLDSFRGDSGEKTWLIRIAINTCRDMHRSAWFRHTDRRVTPDMLPVSSGKAEEKDEDVLLSVMALPVKLRETVLLYFYQNMSMKEIAETLKLSSSAVSARLDRAKKKTTRRTRREGIPWMSKGSENSFTIPLRCGFLTCKVTLG